MTILLNPYHLDEYLPDIDVPLSPDVTIQADLPDGTTWQRMASLYQTLAAEVATTLTAGEPLTVASGDCMTSLGVVAGLQHAGVDPSIVWFDAHGDVQTVETTTSGYLGGMPLRILAGYRPDLISDQLSLRPIDESRIVLTDARDLDPPEIEYLRSSSIRQCAVDDLTTGTLPDGPIYLHIDFDVADPDELPGLLYPAAGGPSLTAVAHAIERVMATGTVVAVGLGCTWHPQQGAADRVRPLVRDVLPR